MALLSSTTMPSFAGVRVPTCLSVVRLSRRSARLVVPRAGSDGPKETSSGGDSYSKIEAPVRDSIPDQGKPVSERNQGQPVLNEQLKSDQFNPDKKLLGTEVGLADAFRFNGAIPEVANSRLAMLGFALAVFGEATTGRNVFQQVQANPLQVAGVFLLFFIATAVPIVRGQPRKSGFGPFTSDAEIVNGRTAMVGFFGLVLLTFYSGSYLGTLASWFT